MGIAQLEGKFILATIAILSQFIFFVKIHACDNIVEKNQLFSSQLEEARIPASLQGISGIPFSTSFQILLEQQQKREQQLISNLCKKIDSTYQKLGWGTSPCFSLPLKYNLVSEGGYPLIYWVFKPDSKLSVEHLMHKKNTTLILGGVHPDELTPIHMAFQLMHEFNTSKELYKNSTVIVAPLVNPDGFFSNPPKRTNANGVDLNRNFPTLTWNKYAHQSWQISKVKDKRKFPGNFANSEQGTRFQTDLLALMAPDKVISIHAPLGFLDLDFEIPKFLSMAPQTEQQKKAKHLTEIISRSAGHYRIIDIGIYPGSLGNYAGNERTIPTITLELSSSNPKLVHKFWNTFFPGIVQVINYEFIKHRLADVR